MNEILKELSWPLKLKVLNEIPGNEKKQYLKPPPVQTPVTYQQSVPTETEKGQNMSSLVRVQSATQAQAVPIAMRRHDVMEAERRSVGLQLLKETSDAAQNDASDDNDMRLKLFRLMYETVRDSDLKVKRAELIKDHYVNSSTFEIGYLVGDITDKSNILTDISMTLKRFYKEWKPIEHINAYEQIANQAIEITHLIDLVRVVHKRQTEHGGSPGSSYVFK